MNNTGKIMLRVTTGLAALQTRSTDAVLGR